MSHLRKKAPSNTAPNCSLASTDWPSDGDANEQSNLPQITVQEEEIETAALSNEERLLAFADLYGRNPVEFETDQHLEAFEREVARLPMEKKCALQKGYTVKQARLFLSIENNDARRAAKRMVRYWDARYKQYGEAAFGQEHLSHRTQEDFRRVYEMALKALVNPEVDEESRRWARKYTDEWAQGHLVWLEEELAKIPDHEKAALVEVQKSRPDIAASDDHRLLFLRCDDFNAPRAARRLVKYWKFKFDIFGRDGALRSVTVNDLMKHHPSELSLGFFWYIPGTDASGRGVLLFVPSKAYASLMPDQGCTEKGLLKVIWYMHHAALEEKSCRENGVVYLSDERFTNFSFFRPSFAFKMKGFIDDGLPVKVKAAHIVAPQVPSFFNIFLPFIKWLLGKKMRMRLWVHTGTDEACLLGLQECGIPQDMIPTSLGGNIDIDHWGKSWLEERKEAGL